MDHKNSFSASYAAAGVDITAGYRAVELMKKHVARTRNAGCLDDVGGFGGCFAFSTRIEKHLGYSAAPSASASAAASAAIPTG